MNRRTLLLATLFFAFLHLLTLFIEAVYTLGLLGVEIPPQIGFVALLLAPLLLLAFPRWLAQRSHRLARWTMAAALLCSSIAALLPIDWRLLVTGLGCGAFLLGLPALLRLRPGAAALGGGLALAGLATAALRALHSGNLLARAPLWLAAAALLGITGLVLLRRLPDGPVYEEDPAPAWTGSAARRYVALTGALALLYFAFSAPAVTARWIGANYAGVTALALLAAGLFAGLWLALPGFAARLTPRLLFGAAVLLALALALSLLPHQPLFPSGADAYPLPAPGPNTPAALALGLALLLHPLVYAAAAQLGHALGAAPPRALARAAALSAVLLLVLLLAQVFTTVYDYIPVIGPVFRDRFWIVTALPAALLALGLWQRRPAPTVEEPAPQQFNGDIAPHATPFSPAPVHTPLEIEAPEIAGVPHAQPAAPPPARQSAPALAAIAALLALAGLIGAAQTYPTAAPGPASLRVMTYNIQQGYDAGGENAYAQQLALIEAQNPDLIGLQESDTARIANANNDVVRYFADRLGYHSYYGPTSTSGTFGIALLSRYPIHNPRTFFLPSTGEQTAAILAEIDAEGKTYTVLVTHLGNGGPREQIGVVMSLLEGREDVLAMGDFNFRPETEQYALVTARYQSAWDAAAERLPLPDGLTAERRIDHVFLGRDLRALQAYYLPEGPSDHPALVVEVE